MIRVAGFMFQSHPWLRDLYTTSGSFALAYRTQQASASELPIRLVDRPLLPTAPIRSQFFGIRQRPTQADPFATALGVSYLGR